MNTNCAFAMANCDKKKTLFDPLFDLKVIFGNKNWRREMTIESQLHILNLGLTELNSIKY